MGHLTRLRREGSKGSEGSEGSKGGRYRPAGDEFYIPLARRWLASFNSFKTPLMIKPLQPRPWRDGKTSQPGLRPAGNTPPIPLARQGGCMFFQRAKRVWLVSHERKSGCEGFIHKQGQHSDELATSGGFSPFGAYGTTFPPLCGGTIKLRITFRSYVALK